MALRFTNFAETTLAADINSVQETITVADASVFPTLAVDDWFSLVLESAFEREILRVQSINGNTLGVLRGQESTAVAAFFAGDSASLRLTAAGMATFPASGVNDLIVRRGVNYGTVTGSGNAMVANVPGLGLVQDGVQVRVRAPTANTASGVTLDVNGLGLTPVVKYNDEPLAAGDIQPGPILDLTYSGSFTAWVLGNPRDQSEDYDLPVATTSVRGGVILAGNATLDTNGDDTKAMTPQAVSRMVDTAVSGGVPAAFRNRGTATEGVLTLTTGATTVGAQAKAEFSTVTVNSGARLNVSGQGTGVIRATGKVTINGEVSLPLQNQNFPTPCIGPIGSMHTGFTVARSRFFAQLQPGKHFRQTASVAAYGFSATQVSADDVRRAILEGVPLHYFTGGSGGALDDDFCSNGPGGLVIVADEIEIGAAAVFRDMFPRPEGYLGVTGATGGGMVLLCASSFIIDPGARFEAATESSFDTEATLDGAADGTPGGANGQVFGLRYDTGAVFRIA